MKKKNTTVDIPPHLSKKYIEPRSTGKEYSDNPELNPLGHKNEGGLSEYTQNMPKQSFKYAVLGASDKEIAKLLNVTTRCFKHWMTKHEKLKDAVHQGRTCADVDVAVSLLEKARGFTQRVQKAFIVDGEIQVIELDQFFPPDIAAAKFWLTNRRGDKWQHMPEVLVDNMQVYAPQIKRYDGSIDQNAEMIDEIIESTKGLPTVPVDGEIVKDDK